MGIVAAIVNVPHALSESEFTTTNPSPAIATMRMIKMATDAVVPLSRLISTFAISARDFASCRIDATRMTKS